MTASYEFFDNQAATFDSRAGLPIDVCREIAKMVLKIGEAQAGHLVLEIGPGTGQIGQWFGSQVRYLGFDKSAGMLKEFQHRLAHDLDHDVDHKVIVQADAKAGWPVASGVARLLFSSRALHLLDNEHIADEAFRVALPTGATLIIGRVKRARASMRHRMAREMNELLRQQGFEGLGGEGRTQRLMEICRARHAEILDTVTVARWKVRASPRQSIDSWRSMTGLGGIAVPTEAKATVLTKLEAWAEETFGGLDHQSESEEEYSLMPLRLRRIRTA